MAYAFASAAADLKQLLHQLNQNTHAALFDSTEEGRNEAAEAAGLLTRKVEQLIQVIGQEVSQVHAVLNGPAYNLVHMATSLVELMELRDQLGISEADAPGFLGTVLTNAAALPEAV